MRFLLSLVLLLSSLSLYATEINCLVRTYKGYNERLVIHENGYKQGDYSNAYTKAVVTRIKKQLRTIRDEYGTPIVNEITTTMKLGGQASPYQLQVQAIENPDSNNERTKIILSVLDLRSKMKSQMKFVNQQLAVLDFVSEKQSELSYRVECALNL